MSTATKTRPVQKTLEEKKAQAAALHESIAAQVDQLSTTEAWTRFLDFAKGFHAYSLNNLLLILSQCPEATQVAGFRKWQALGRQVRKGETGIRIFGYSTKKVTEEDESGYEVEKRIARFPILSVFDIGQTDLIDGEADSSNITAQLTGADDFGIVEVLSTYLVGEGWTVERRALAGAKNGYASPAERAVVVDDGLSLEHAAKTFIHETAHIVLGHTDDAAGYAEHRGLCETEAESVAYVVAGMVGFDTSAYSVGYIAGWTDGDTELIRSTATRVLRAAHQIAEILTPDSGLVDEETGDI